MTQLTAAEKGTARLACELAIKSEWALIDAYKTEINRETLEKVIAKENRGVYRQTMARIKRLKRLLEKLKRAD